MLEIERGSIGSHSTANSFWRNLWTCHKIGSRMFMSVVKNGNETKHSLCIVPRYVAVNNAFKAILSPTAIKRTLVFMLSIPYFCLILPEFGFPQHIFTQVSNIKFHENPLIESRVHICQQAARIDEARRGFSRECKRA